MTRRIVLGRRGAEFGLWVSKPGYDAATAPDTGLLFGMTKRFGMVLASGTVVCPTGGATASVSFGATQPAAPLIFCGSLTEQPSPYPVATTVSTTGFTVRALSIWDGSYPAGGRSLRWFAVAKNQDA